VPNTIDGVPGFRVPGFRGTDEKSVDYQFNSALTGQVMKEVAKQSPIPWLVREKRRWHHAPNNQKVRMVLFADGTISREDRITEAYLLDGQSP